MRSLACAALVVTVALALGACSDDDPPWSPPTTQATTPADPDATLPPMPEAAGEFSAKGAASFVRRYVEVLDYASKTGEVLELERLSDSGCEGCAAYVDRFKSIYGAGGHTEGHQWTIGESRVRFYPSPEDESLVTTTLSISGGTMAASATHSPTQFTSVSSAVSFGLRFDNRWRVTQFAMGDVG